MALAVNYSKTKEIIMGPPSITANLPLIKTTAGHIERVNSTILLGIHLDSNFSWQPHIEAILQWLRQLNDCTSWNNYTCRSPSFSVTTFLLDSYTTGFWICFPCLAPSDYKEAVWSDRSHSEEGHPYHLPLCTRYAVCKCHLPSWPGRSQDFWSACAFTV